MWRALRRSERGESKSVPKTAALQDQKIRSMDAIEKWGLDCLMRGCIGTEGAWETSIETQKIQESLAATVGMAGSKTHATDTALGMKLTKSVAELNKVRVRKQWQNV